MAACTSASATSRLRFRSNCSVMTEAPAELLEDISFRPGIWPNDRSRGPVTVEAITSGLAPGQECLHLDGRIIDLWQGRDRQQQIADDPEDDDGHHQQGGGDRPQDVRPGRVHGLQREPRVSLGSRGEWTFAGCSVAPFFMMRGDSRAARVGRFSRGRAARPWTPAASRPATAPKRRREADPPRQSPPSHPASVPSRTAMLLPSVGPVVTVRMVTV